MDQTTAAAREFRVSANARFWKRRKTFMKKAEELRANFDAHVYVVVYYAGKYSTYVSHPELAHQWPPPPREIVRTSSEITCNPFFT